MPRVHLHDFMVNKIVFFVVVVVLGGKKLGGGRGIVFAGQKSVSMDRHYFESTPKGVNN